MNIESVVSLINQIGLRTLGIPNIFGDRMICLDDLTGKYQPIGGVFELNPAMCGPLAAMITKLSVKIKAGTSQNHDMLYMIFEYAYTHENGGRNGYELRITEKLSKVIV